MYYDIERILSNAVLLSDSTVADCFFYECDDLGGVQDVLDEIDEFMALLPKGVTLSDLPEKICGNKKTKIYGRAVCSATGGHLIIAGDNTNSRMDFDDEADAKNKGYRPCAKCMPDSYRIWKEERNYDKDNIY